MNPLFSERECKAWAESRSRGGCCKNPDVVKYLRQDRAIDEMPNLYGQCRNCLRVVRYKSK